MNKLLYGSLSLEVSVISTQERDGLSQEIHFRSLSQPEFDYFGDSIE